MKNLYLGIAATIFSLTCIAQDVFIPDQVFKSRLLEEGVDTNNDGIIQESEALAVTILQISGIGPDNADITNLTGIEYFTNIQTLDISYHELSDVTLSALTNLEIFTATSNNFTTINLDGLNALTELRLSFNQLTSLDLSGLSNLKKLSLANNDLNEIDLTHTPNLESISIPNNNLSTLDVSFLTSLEDILCSGNDISELDVSSLTGLTQLSCSNNPIEQLDLSNLTELEAIAASNTIISEIDGSNTKIRDAQLASCPLLTSINFRNGYLFIESDPDLLIVSLNLQFTPELAFICIDNEPEEISAVAISGYNDDTATVYSGEDCSEEIENINGLNTSTSLFIELYPNPFSNTFSITNQELLTHFKITDITGRIILDTASYERLLNTTSGMTSGTYFLQVSTIDNRSNTIKIIKR